MMNEEMRWNVRYATNIPISYVSCIGVYEDCGDVRLKGSRYPQEWQRRILA
jgi:hypothetical protein